MQVAEMLIGVQRFNTIRSHWYIHANIPGETDRLYNAADIYPCANFGLSYLADTADMDNLSYPTMQLYLQQSDEW